MSSRVETKKKINELDYQQPNEQHFSMRTTTVQYTIPGTELKFSRELLYIDHLNCDLFNAINSFRETVKLTNWTPEIAFNVLRSLIRDEIKKEIGEFNDCEQRIKNLFLLKYPKSRTEYY
ncbi:MAG: hypothetical protein ACRC1D_03955, partial [Culicoidibacterales bacterium]